MKKLNLFTTSPLKTLIPVLCLLLQHGAGLAAPKEAVLNPQVIGEKAVAYVKSLFPAPSLGEMSYKAVRLDKRIKIKPCDKDLHLSIPGNASLKKQTTVLVRCDAAKSWNLYVQVRITQMIPVVVAKNSLAPGTLISGDNLIVIKKDATQVRGRTLQQPDSLYGAKASRYITAGQPVTMRTVCLVCKGDSVTVTAKIKGLRVKTSGISLQNGSLGDNIAILNQRTSKRLKAKVVAVNRVEINI
jgi:flagella basal body P-ring formation protein FlgA